jgi:chromosome segregation ATPase
MSVIRKITTGVADVIAEGAGVIAEKSEEAARIGKLKLELPRLKMRIHNLLVEIGEQVAHLDFEKEADLGKNAAIRGLAEQVCELENKQVEITAQIDLIDSERKRRRHEAKEASRKQKKAAAPQEHPEDDDARAE